MPAEQTSLGGSSAGCHARIEPGRACRRRATVVGSSSSGGRILAPLLGACELLGVGGDAAVSVVDGVVPLHHFVQQQPRCGGNPSTFVYLLRETVRHCVRFVEEGERVPNDSGIHSAHG